MLTRSLNASFSGTMSSSSDGGGMALAGRAQQYSASDRRIAAITEQLKSNSFFVTVKQFPRYESARYLAGMGGVDELLRANIGAALDGGPNVAQTVSRVLVLRGPADCGLQQAVERYCETCGHSLTLITYRAYTASTTETSAEFWNAVYELAQLKRQCVVMIDRLSERSSPEVATGILNAMMCAWFRMSERRRDTAGQVWTVFNDAVNPADIFPAWRQTCPAEAAFVEPQHEDNVRALLSALDKPLRDEGLVPAPALAEQYAQIIGRVTAPPSTANSNRPVVVDISGAGAVDRFVKALLTARAARGRGPFTDSDFQAAATACSRVVESVPAFSLPAIFDAATPQLPSHAKDGAGQARRRDRFADDRDMLGGGGDA